MEFLCQFTLKRNTVIWDQIYPSNHFAVQLLYSITYLSVPIEVVFIYCQWCQKTSWYDACAEFGVWFLSKFLPGVVWGSFPGLFISNLHLGFCNRFNLNLRRNFPSKVQVEGRFLFFSEEMLSCRWTWYQISMVTRIHQNITLFNLAHD